MIRNSSLPSSFGDVDGGGGESGDTTDQLRGSRRIFDSCAGDSNHTEQAADSLVEPTDDDGDMIDLSPDPDGADSPEAGAGQYDSPVSSPTDGEHLAVNNVETVNDGGAGGYEKPKETFMNLIAQAIMSSEKKMMILTDIYDYLERTHPHYRHCGNKKAWQNAVRHNLSLHDCFVKLPRYKVDMPTTSCYWKLSDKAVEMYKTGLSLKRAIGNSRRRPRSGSRRMQPYKERHPGMTMHQQFPLSASNYPVLGTGQHMPSQVHGSYLGKASNSAAMGPSVQQPNHHAAYGMLQPNPGVPRPTALATAGGRKILLSSSAQSQGHVPVAEVPTAAMRGQPHPTVYRFPVTAASTTTPYPAVPGAHGFATHGLAHQRATQVRRPHAVQENPAGAPPPTAPPTCVARPPNSTQATVNHSVSQAMYAIPRLEPNHLARHTPKKLVADPDVEFSPAEEIPMPECRVSASGRTEFIYDDDHGLRRVQSCGRTSVVVNPTFLSDVWLHNSEQRGRDSNHRREIIFQISKEVRAAYDVICLESKRKANGATMKTLLQQAEVSTLVGRPEVPDWFCSPQRSLSSQHAPSQKMLCPKR